MQYKILYSNNVNMNIKMLNTCLKCMINDLLCFSNMFVTATYTIIYFV